MCNELFEERDLGRVCEAIVKAGFEGIEIAPYTLADDPREIDEARAEQLGRTVRDSGLSVVGLHWLLARPEGLHLTTADDAVRARTTEFLRHLARICSAMEGSLLVLGSPRQRDVPPGERPEDAFERAAEVCRGVCETAGPLGVTLAVRRGLTPLVPMTFGLATLSSVVGSTWAMVAVINLGFRLVVLQALAGYLLLAAITWGMRREG